MTQVNQNQSNWLVAVNKVLPDIEYFLKNDLAKEPLSDFSDERRKEILKKLEDIRKPPDLPPRKTPIKTPIKRVNTGGYIGSPTLSLTPDAKRKYSDGILAAPRHTYNEAEEEFIKKQREISRKWGHDQPDDATTDIIEEEKPEEEVAKMDSQSVGRNSNIYERIMSDEGSVRRRNEVPKNVDSSANAPAEPTAEDEASAPPVPDRAGRGRLKHSLTTWPTADQNSKDPVLLHSLKDPSCSGPIKDLRAGEKLWCVLKAKKLYFFRNLVVPAHEIINMSEYDIHIDNVGKTMFRLNKPGFPSFLLRADGEEDFEKWIGALEKCKYEELRVTPPPTENSDDESGTKEGDGEDGYEKPEDLLRKFEEERKMKLRQKEFERSKSSNPPRSPSDCYVDMSGNAGTSDSAEDYQHIDPPSPDFDPQIASPPQKRDSYYEKRSLPPIPVNATEATNGEREKKTDAQSDDNSLSGGFDSLDSDDEDDQKRRKESALNLGNQARTKKLQEKKGKEFDFFHDLDAVYCGILHQRKFLAVWLKRYCKIKDNTLTCRGNPDDTEKPILEVPLKGCKLQMAAKETKRTTAFKLRRPNDDILYFAAETKDHLMKWITTLASAIDDRTTSKESDTTGDSHRRKRHSQVSNEDTNSVDSKEYQIIDEFFDDKGNLKRQDSGSDFDADSESDVSSMSDDDRDEGGDKPQKSTEFGTVKNKIIRKLRKKNRMSAGSSDDLEDADTDIRGYLYRFQASRWFRRWCVIKHKKLHVYKKASMHQPELTLQLDTATLSFPTRVEQARLRYNLFQLESPGCEKLYMSSVSQTDLEVWRTLLVTVVNEVKNEADMGAPVPPPPWYTKRSLENGSVGLNELRDRSQLTERKSADISTLNVNGKLIEIKYKSGKPTEVERWFSLMGRELKIADAKECIDPVWVLDLRHTIIRRMKIEDQNTGYMFSFEFGKDKEEKTIDFKIDEETQKTLTPVLWASEARLVGFDTMTLDRRRKWTASKRDGISAADDNDFFPIADRKPSIIDENRAHSADTILSSSSDGSTRREKATSVPESILQATLPGPKVSTGDLFSRGGVRSTAFVPEKLSTGNRLSRIFKSLGADRRHKKNKYRMTKEEEEREAKLHGESHPKEQFHGMVHEVKKGADGAVERIPRFCRISGKIFYVFESEKALKPHFRVPLSSALLEDRIDANAKLYTIVITSMDENKEFTFTLNSEQELDTWMTALTEPNYVALAQSSKESLLSDDIDNKSKESDTSIKEQADGIVANSVSTRTAKSPSASSDERKISVQERPMHKTRESDSSLETVRLEGYLFESKSLDLTTTRVRHWVVLRKTTLELYESKKDRKPRILPLNELIFSVGDPDEKREKLKLIFKYYEETITLLCADEKQHQEWFKELKRLIRRRTRVGSDSSKSKLKSRSGSLKQLLMKSDSGKSKRATLLLDDKDEEAVEKYVDFLNPINTLSGTLREISDDGRSKERFCYIRDNCFVVCKSNKPEKKIRKIDLSTVTLLDESDAAAGKYEFKLDDGKGKGAVFACQDAQSADRWMVAVSMAMLLDKLQFRGSRTDLQKSASDYEFLTLEDGAPETSVSSSALPTAVDSVDAPSTKKNSYRKSSSADDLLVESTSKRYRESVGHSLSDLTLIFSNGKQSSQSEAGNESTVAADENGEVKDTRKRASETSVTPKSSVSCQSEGDEENGDLKHDPKPGEYDADRRGSSDSFVKINDLLQNKEFLESEKYLLQRCIADAKVVVDESKTRRRLSRSSGSSPDEINRIDQEFQTSKGDLQKLKRRLNLVEKELKKINNEIHRRYSKSYLSHVRSAQGAAPSNKWYTDSSLQKGDSSTPSDPTSTIDEVFDQEEPKDFLI